MPRDAINAGSAPIAAMGDIASNYARSVAFSNEQAGSIFDKYLAHQKSLRDEAMQKEQFELNKQALNEKIETEKATRQNEVTKGLLAQKELQNYDKKQELLESQVKAENQSRAAAAGLNLANAANINQQTQDIRELKKMRLQEEEERKAKEAEKAAKINEAIKKVGKFFTPMLRF